MTQAEQAERLRKDVLIVFAELAKIAPKKLSIFELKRRTGLDGRRVKAAIDSMTYVAPIYEVDVPGVGRYKKVIKYGLLFVPKRFEERIAVIK
jgi:hypothetical protein